MRSPTANAAPNANAMMGKLRELLLEKIEGGKLVLPALPSTAARVMECLEKPQPDPSQVVKLLENDPVLSLELLRIANSTLYAPKVRIDSLGRAISQIGQRNLRNVLLAASARQVFSSRIPEVREILNRFWVHSVGVAVVARQVSVHAALTDKDAPYMAGLLHDIGKPVVAIHLLELERAVSRSRQSKWIEPRVWLSVVDEIHRDVGVAIAKHWALSDEVCKAIADCVEYDAADRKSAANTVRFANALAKREGIYVGDVDEGQISTVLMIGRSMIGLTDDAIEGMARSLHDAATSEAA